MMSYLSFLSIYVAAKCRDLGPAQFEALRTGYVLSDFSSIFC